MESSFYEEIITIVPRNSGELVTRAAKEAGSFGGTIGRGRGTASNSFLQMLGFGDSSKDLVYIVANHEKSKLIREAIIDASKDKKRPFGVLFTLKTSSFFKAGYKGAEGRKEEKMTENKEENANMGEKAAALANGNSEAGFTGEYNPSTHKLITVIVNRGYADDAMDAARKAGAGGGTIINARGTAREGDATFFGMEIVPEKDMILIVADNEKADSIIEAIRSLPCLSNPGSGVAFTSPASDFTVLGRPKN